MDFKTNKKYIQPKQISCDIKFLYIHVMCAGVDRLFPGAVGCESGNRGNFKETRKILKAVVLF